MTFRIHVTWPGAIVPSTIGNGMHFWCIALAPCQWLARIGDNRCVDKLELDFKVTRDSHEIKQVIVCVTTLLFYHKVDQTL